MDLKALGQLTTKELVEISEAAGKLVEDRLSGAIKRFFELLLEKGVPAQVPKVMPDASIMVEIELTSWDSVKELINDPKLIPPLGIAGVNPRLEVEYVDKNKYRFDLFLQDWPQQWEFLRDMDDESLPVAEVLDCFNGLFTE